MNKYIRGIVLISFMLILLIAADSLWAYWIWTPETKKFINPKYAVKDSPKEQFDWAMGFYQSKDYQRAAQEFEKLTKQYEYSEYASKAQYYVGLCYENMNKFYFAFQNYQKAIDNYPHLENMDEIIAREFNIANIYEAKASPKVMGTDIMTSTDRAVEIYKKVVDNAPFGRLADEAQFRMGQAFKKAERFDEAIPAFQKILDDYPNSQFVDKTKFEVADCAYKASLKPAYDIESTDKAIKAFEDFSQANRDEKLSGDAAKTIQRLKDKSAEKSLMTAQFYEGQGRFESALIYYRDVVARFPDCSMIDKVKARITELENRGRKKVQSTGIMGQKKSWMPFSLPKKEKPVKAETAKDETKSQKKGWWNPFKTAGKTKAPEAIKEETKAQKKGWWDSFKPAVKEEVKTEKKEKKSWWKPLSFTKEPKAAEPVTAKKEVKTEKKGWWKPLKFTKEAKTAEPAAVAVKEVVKEEVKQEVKKETKEEAVQEVKEEAEETRQEVKEAVAEPAAVKEEVREEVKTIKKEKKGWWKPLNFTKETKTAEPVAAKQEVKKEKKGWVPFSLPKKEKPAKVETTTNETKTEKKGWTPLSFKKRIKMTEPEPVPENKE